MTNKMWDEICVIPYGLCGNRDEHKPHLEIDTSMGTFYCHADQTKRLPYAAEMRRRSGS